MGRAKEFCVEGALTRALEVFWRHGFEGASLTDLTAAMGITRPSLYATYGNKEALFRKALDLYDERYLGFSRAALNEPAAHGVVRDLLKGFVELATCNEHPRGCMGTQGALVCSTAADPIKDELVRRRGAFEMVLAARFERARSEGDLPLEESAGDLARFVMTVAGGIAVQAAGGAPRAALERVAAMAQRACPALSETAEPPRDHVLA